MKTWKDVAATQRFSTSYPAQGEKDDDKKSAWEQRRPRAFVWKDETFFCIMEA